MGIFPGSLAVNWKPIATNIKMWTLTYMYKIFLVRIVPDDGHLSGFLGGQLETKGAANYCHPHRHIHSVQLINLENKTNAQAGAHILVRHAIVW